MASISNTSGRHMIQFVGGDGKRRPIRLRKCDGRTAEVVKLHVERLVESRSLGMPLHIFTVGWLRSIGQHLYGRLAIVGLCESRAVGLRGSMPIKQMLDS